jgi:hypothetical protein
MEPRWNLISPFQPHWEKKERASGRGSSAVARRLGVDDGRPGVPTRLRRPPTSSWLSPGRRRALVARAVPQLLVNGDASANGCGRLSRNQRPNRPGSARRGEYARARGSCGEEDGSARRRGKRRARTKVLTHSCGARRCTYQGLLESARADKPKMELFA